MQTLPGKLTKIREARCGFRISTLVSVIAWAIFVGFSIFEVSNTKFWYVLFVSTGIFPTIWFLRFVVEDMHRCGIILFQILTAFGLAGAVLNTSIVAVVWAVGDRWLRDIADEFDLSIDPEVIRYSLPFHLIQFFFCITWLKWSVRKRRFMREFPEVDNAKAELYLNNKARLEEVLPPE